MDYRLITLKDGTISTIHKSKVEEFKAKGYKIGAKAKGASARDIKNALGIEKYGKAYQDKGKYEGYVAIEQKDGKTAYAKQDVVEQHLKQGRKLGNIKNIR